jgi:hypothetical protein
MKHRCCSWITVVLLATGLNSSPALEPQGKSGYRGLGMTPWLQGAADGYGPSLWILHRQGSVMWKPCSGAFSLRW